MQSEPWSLSSSQCSLIRLCRSLDVFENLERRQSPVRAHDSAARMGRRAAHVKILDRCAILRPACDRPQEEELLEGKLTLEDVALTQSPFAFEIERRDHLLFNNDVLDVGRVLGDGIDHGVAEGFLLIVPVQARPQLVGSVLHKARHHMLARRRDGRIGKRGNDHVNVRTLREVAILSIVVGSLHVFDGWRNRNRTSQMRSRTGEAFEVGQRTERHVYLAGGAAKLEAIDFLEKVAGKMLSFDEPCEGKPRVDAGRNYISVDLIAGSENHTFCLTAFDDDIRDAGLGANLDARLASCVGNGVRNGPSPSTRKAPGAERAINLSHVVM